MKQAQKDSPKSEGYPMVRSAWVFTLAAVPTYIACFVTTMILLLLMEGKLKEPLSKALIEMGILWLVTLLGWIGASRWLSQDSWLKESRKISWSGLAFYIVTAPGYQFIREWSRAAASGNRLEFDTMAAIVTAPFWGTMFFCLVQTLMLWSTIHRANSAKVRDNF